jgi:plastocyanin
MKKILPIIGVLLIVGVVVALISNGKKDDNGKVTTPAPTPSTQNNSNANPPSSNTSQANTVSIENMAFTPATLSVKKGTTVTWTNNDSVEHTVTADNGVGPNSQSLENGKSYSFKFDQVGTFKYHCSIHSSMQGSVEVTE